MLVGRNHRKIPFWDGVVDKIKNILATWKGKIISFTGRVCLLK